MALEGRGRLRGLYLRAPPSATRSRLELRPMPPARTRSFHKAPFASRHRVIRARLKASCARGPQFVVGPPKKVYLVPALVRRAGPSREEGVWCPALWPLSLAGKRCASGTRHPHPVPDEHEHKPEHNGGSRLWDTDLGTTSARPRHDLSASREV